MISEERDESANPRLLLWAFAASILIHALILPAAFWRWSLSLISAQPPQREWVASSTAVRIEHREVPQPRSQPHRQPQPLTPRPQSAAAPAAVAPQAARPEIARSAPTAPPQPQRSPDQPAQTSLAQQLEQQQSTFSQEVARLHSENAPLSIASKPEKPSAYRRTYFDVPGHAFRNEVQAILIPVRHWRAGSLSCYYARYVAQFTTGASEEGVIPWPVCYPANDDVMVNPPYPHDLPIPLPQRDYVLPPGTYLTPLLKTIYDRRG